MVRPSQVRDLTYVGIDWECWTVEILALSQVIEKVENHPCELHERQPKNGVD